MNIDKKLYNDELARIGLALREARLSAGLSLESVALQLGVAASTIGKIERGLWNPSAGYLVALARVYGLSWNLAGHQ